MFVAIFSLQTADAGHLHSEDLQEDCGICLHLSSADDLCPVETDLTVPTENAATNTSAFHTPAFLRPEAAKARAPPVS